MNAERGDEIEKDRARHRRLLVAADRLERFVLSDTPTYEEYDEYFVNADRRYDEDVKLLVEQARAFIVGLSWDERYSDLSAKLRKVK